MTNREAIDILRAHNAWRRGQTADMGDPKRIGEAMDMLIRFGERKLEQQRKEKK